MHQRDTIVAHIKDSKTLIIFFCKVMVLIPQHLFFRWLDKLPQFLKENLGLIFDF